MDHAVQWNYNIYRLCREEGAFQCFYGTTAFTDFLPSKCGLSVAFRQLFPVAPDQYYRYSSTMQCRLCTVEYVSLLKIAGWRSIYSEWRTLTTSQNSGISMYSVFGRCAERYVLQVLYLTSQYLCTVIGNIRGRQTMLWYFYNFRNIILKMGFSMIAVTVACIPFLA